MKASVTGLAIAMSALVWAGGAEAQYDKDGRYVPSPNGVPADPYARPVTGYPGTPGGTVGTPSLPRYMTPPAPAPMTPRKAERDYVPPSGRRAISVEFCENGWSKRTGMRKREYETRCAELLRRTRRDDD